MNILCDVYKTEARLSHALVAGFFLKSFFMYI